MSLGTTSIFSKQVSNCIIWQDGLQSVVARFDVTEFSRQGSNASPLYWFFLSRRSTMILSHVLENFSCIARLVITLIFLFICLVKLVTTVCLLGSVRSINAASAKWRLWSDCVHASQSETMLAAYVLRQDFLNGTHLASTSALQEKSQWTI